MRLTFPSMHPCDQAFHGRSRLACNRIGRALYRDDTKGAHRQEMLTERWRPLQTLPSRISLARRPPTGGERTRHDALQD
jgi:hypothetical protein